MAKKMLRLRAKGDALLQDLEAMDAGVRRFVGRKFSQMEPGQWAFVPNDEVVEKPARAEYVQAVKEGDAWAADQLTAD